NTSTRNVRGSASIPLRSRNSAAAAGSRSSSFLSRTPTATRSKWYSGKVAIAKADPKRTFKTGTLGDAQHAGRLEKAPAGGWGWLNKARRIGADFGLEIAP